MIDWHKNLQSALSGRLAANATWAPLALPVTSRRQGDVLLLLRETPFQFQPDDEEMSP